MNWNAREHVGARVVRHVDERAQLVCLCPPSPSPNPATLSRSVVGASPSPLLSRLDSLLSLCVHVSLLGVPIMSPYVSSDKPF